MKSDIRPVLSSDRRRSQTAPTGALRKGDLVKILWHDGVGTSLYLKRLEAGKFIWPVSRTGDAVQISAAQLGYLLEGIDWRNPRWTQRPAKVG